MKLDLNEINTLEDLKKLKNKLYASGSEYYELQQQIKNATFEDKKNIGIKLSNLRLTYENFFKEAEKQIENKRIENLIANDYLDINKPVNFIGSLHPITLIEERMRIWFDKHGYFESQGGEIVSEEYNFDRLNILKNHPARDMQDSLYLNQNYLLRTHNTAISAMTLEKFANQKISTYTIGKVYRNDEDDSTHSHQFTQLDFISVGQVSFANLMWTLKSLLSYVFEIPVKLRLRPSYFPFTEPSVEVDVYYKNRWIEVLGAGMLHPNVLKNAGYNTNKFNGFAAGIGLERLAMIKYNIKDIREFYKNDVRTLQQFKNQK
ncbi:phenylalanine--tRNA ligase subunit alpha [Mycoplasma sp. 1018B]|uniref:phenylalanine--tRNA ligase subunit alpha n=1 Tax=Mycoplasma sp. 1018B TaxID=2967302 RepID=UPI00211C1153|nr:phenylalanine--tRNA ligase subunit alpha [Mycoplasma sp. 1018B]UUM19112.1 phenylalanine--tRNA ligase subunit alpha [Mycoplasma sp. 1018B]